MQQQKRQLTLSLHTKRHEGKDIPNCLVVGGGEYDDKMLAVSNLLVLWGYGRGLQDIKEAFFLQAPKLGTQENSGWNKICPQRNKAMVY